MKFRNGLPSVEEVKNIDIVDYLSTLGITPKLSRNNYWYFSPLRDETTPSFKVNGNINRRYDFGESKCGYLVDFGTQFHKCSVSELLKKISGSFSFQQQNTFSKKEEEEAKKIRIISEREITSLGLIRYLHKRRIPVEIATKFCKEIDYELYGKNYYAIGFKNNAAGYELRNKKSKACSSPKDVTLIENRSDKLTFFEGFLISFLTSKFIKNQNNRPPIF